MENQASKNGVEEAQKWKTMEKLWKGTQCLLFDRNVKTGGEELWTSLY